jgi:CheY-specific phosphatase CheX
MILSADEFQRLVVTIWSTQLGLTLEKADSEEIEAALSERESVVIGVEITGDFEGTLVQRCSHHVALLAAKAAFANREGELGAGDARDVLAEIAHMTAGNLKSLLPGKCSVSLPATSESSGHGVELEAEAGFRLENEPLIVSLTR